MYIVKIIKYQESKKVFDFHVESLISSSRRNIKIYTTDANLSEPVDMILSALKNLKHYY